MPIKRILGVLSLILLAAPVMPGLPATLASTGITAGAPLATASNASDARGAGVRAAAAEDPMVTDTRKLIDTFVQLVLLDDDRPEPVGPAEVVDSVHETSSTRDEGGVGNPPTACSSACATRRQVASSKRRPMSISPAGSPSTRPAGTDVAG